MPRPLETTSTLPRASPLGTSVATGPYRARFAMGPSAAARIEQALSAAHRARRRAVRSERRLRWIAAAGYVAAALAAGPRGEEGGSRTRTAAWTCMAAGATCAMLLAGRAGTRAHDIEAEIAWIQRLSDTHSRAPRA